MIQVLIGMAILVATLVLLGNVAISWLMPSDTKKVGVIDVVRRFGGYRAALSDEQLRQALAILDRDRSWFDSKVSTSLLVTALCGAAATLLAFIVLHSLPAALFILAIAVVLTIPLGVKLAKASAIGTADAERGAFRSILSMYLTVLAVELRSHPIEIALRDMTEITYSPIAERITIEIQKKLDTVAQASSSATSTPSDMSLGRAMIDLGKDWAIPELELIGEIMHGSVFSPEALSDMILQQSETMKKTQLRQYAKKIEAQRPKLSMFALLQVMPLMIFLVVPIMETLSKGGI